MPTIDTQNTNQAPTAITLLSGFVLNGIDEGDFSGRSVSSAGDINGDGFDDILIGARSADPNGRSDAGESYVVFGSSGRFSASLDLSSLNGRNGFVLNGIDAGDLSGYSVSSAGDINGDGFDDILIGARSADPNGRSDAGESYMVFGSSGGFSASLNLSSLNGRNGFVINGIDAGDGSGRSVSSAGDINGDGFDDILIGARSADPNGNSSAGESYVVFGVSDGFSASLNLSSLNGRNGFVLNGIDAGDLSGYSVSSAGDINGDGFDDILIGASGADPNGNSSAGESYVVFGSSGGFSASLNLSSLNGRNGFVINGIDFGDGSGGSVSSAGDINGDGFDDIFIGARSANPNGNSGAGESYVVFGASGGFTVSLDLSALDGSNGFVINGIDEDDFSGRSVSRAGDVNGDGFDDILIGASGVDPNNRRDAGESYVVFGSSGGFSASLDLSSLNGRNGFVINGIDRDDGSGFSVSSAGDVNGDGFDDILIGAIFADPNGNSYAGESYVVFGRSNFGASLELANLANNNTVDENSSNGTVIAILNTIDPDLNDTFTYTLLDDAGGRFALEGNQLVVANSSLLDFETNTSHTIIVQTTDSNGLSLSQTFTIFVNNIVEVGNDKPTAITLLSGFVLNGIDEGDLSGRSVSSAGDVNGDGFDDILIGASNASPNDNSFSYAGESYVVFGSSGGFDARLDLATLDGSNGFVINGINTYGNSGYSVSSAGDVNGDGFDDIIIGTNLTSIYDTGESYVVFGSSGGFSASLDLSSLNGRNGFVINGIDGGDRSGRSVSSAGDINGDGFDDILIGATGADPNGNNYAGESYVVFGSSGGFSASLDLSSLNGRNGFVINGIDVRDYSGFSVSSAGDINGDGFDDIFIGARSANPNGNSGAGESYVVFGASGGFAVSLDLSALDGSNGFVINGIDSSDFSGYSVSSAGDINGDGFDDILIGATGADPNGRSDAGESYVVFGSSGGFSASLDLSSLNGRNGFVINGIDGGDRSGRSVSSAGDINGDGFDDILIGATGADPNGNYSAGESYVVFGRSNFGASLELANFANVNIDENSSNGIVIAILSTTDPDPNDTSFTYTLLNDADGRFAVDGDRLIVADGSLLDFETNASHSISVQTTDSGGLSLSQTFTIFVNNVLNERNIINGTTGRDDLLGTNNDDVITGLQGRDTLTGGLGNDEFVYTSILDAGDILTDFTPDADQINLAAVLDSLGYTGNDAIADGFVSFQARGSDTLLQLDSDGFGSAKARRFILVEDITVTQLNNSSNFIF